MLNKKALVKLILVLALLGIFAAACLLTPAEKIPRDSYLFMRGMGIGLLALLVALLVLAAKSLASMKRKAAIAPSQTLPVVAALPVPQVAVPLSGEELPPPVEKDGIFYCGYFKASARLIGHDLGLGMCQLCGQPGDCLRIYKQWTEPNRHVYFIRNYETVKPQLEARSVGVDHYRICLDCLRRGALQCCHPTDLGYLKPEGFPGKVLDEKQKRVPHKAIAELFRTPPIRVNQEEIWQTHCDDFMDFIGMWAREDFARHAPDGDPKKLYYEMGSGDGEWKNWDSSGETYYAFRCRHCGKYRGYYDLD